MLSRRAGAKERGLNSGSGGLLLPSKGRSGWGVLEKFRKIYIQLCASGDILAG
jgi:hypothetical protein